MEPRPPSWKILLAFAIIYFVWGSTFLAIRVGVHEVPPFLLAALRFFAAGLALYAWMRLKGTPAPSRRARRSENRVFHECPPFCSAAVKRPTVRGAPRLPRQSASDGRHPLTHSFATACQLPDLLAIASHNLAKATGVIAVFLESRQYVRVDDERRGKT